MGTVYAVKRTVLSDVRSLKEVGLDLIRRHALLKDPVTMQYGQDVELARLLDELTAAMVKEHVEAKSDER